MVDTYCKTTTTQFFVLFARMRLVRKRSTSARTLPSETGQMSSVFKNWTFCYCLSIDRSYKICNECRPRGVISRCCRLPCLLDKAHLRQRCLCTNQTRHRRSRHCYPRDQGRIQDSRRGGHLSIAAKIRELMIFMSYFINVHANV